MDRRLAWIVQKGALAAALCLAVLGQLTSLQYAATAITWWTLVTALWSGPGERIARAAVPLAAVMAFDVAILGSMFLAHWYWTAFAYAASCGLAALAEARAAKP